MKKTMLKRLAVVYGIFLHCALAGILWKSDFLDRVNKQLGLSEFTKFYHQIVLYHARSVDAVPDDAVILIGDSLTQGLAVAAVHPLAVNYGIGGDTTKGVLERLSIYRPALQRSKCIVIAIGFNDMGYRNVSDAISYYSQILDELPLERPIIISAILPIDQSAHKGLANRTIWIQQFNAELKKLVSKKERMIFVDNSSVLDSNRNGQLDQSLHIGDGVHLNSAGNRIWAANLRNAIDNLTKAE